MYVYRGLELILEHLISQVCILISKPYFYYTNVSIMGLHGCYFRDKGEETAT